MEQYPAEIKKYIYELSHLEEKNQFLLNLYMIEKEYIPQVFFISNRLKLLKWTSFELQTDVTRRAISQKK